MAFDAAATGDTPRKRRPGGGVSAGAGDVTTTAVGGDGGGREETSELGLISRRVLALAQVNNSLDAALRQLGTASDTVSFRANLAALEKRGTTLNGEVESGMRRIRADAMAKPGSQLAKMTERLTEQYLEIRSMFSQRLQISQQRQKQYVVQADPATASPAGVATRAGPGGRKRPDDAAALIELQRVKVLDDVDEAIALERRDKAEAIARAAVEIRDTTREISGMVQDQGEALTVVEDNVDRSLDKVIVGNNDLEKAAEYQTCYRRKCICLIFLILAVIVVITVPLLIHYLPAASTSDGGGGGDPSGGGGDGGDDDPSGGGGG